VAYLGYGRHGSCHFDGGAKITWQKSKFVTCSFFDLYFAPQTTINPTAASIEAPLTNAIIRECCASIKNCVKTAALWHNTMVIHCDRTSTLACNIYKTSSSRYKEGSVTSCCHFSGKRMLVSLNLVRTWFNSVTVRIWLLRNNCF